MYEMPEALQPKREVKWFLGELISE